MYPLSLVKANAGHLCEKLKSEMKSGWGMLGHYSAGFTLDTYAHVTTDAQLKAAQTMGNILSRAV